MKKIFSIYVNIALGVGLIIANTYESENRNMGEALGASILIFAIGLVLGVVLTGIFMFFYGILKPKNKIKLGMSERITTGLICAILYSFIR